MRRSAVDRDGAVVPPPPAIAGTASGSFGRLSLAALTLGLAASLLPGAPSSSRVPPRCALEIVTPPTAAPESVAISPDGRTIAYVATSEGQSRLWLRSLESGLSRGRAGNRRCGVSRSGRPTVGPLRSLRSAKLRHVAVDGGSVQTLANATGEGGTWNQDNVILYASLGSPITRIPAAGGQPVPLPGLAQQGSDFAPHFLPDGRRFLYFVRGNPEVRGVYVGQLDATLERSPSARFRHRRRLRLIRTPAVRPARHDSLRRPSIRTAWSWPVSPSLLRRACLAIGRIPSPFRVPGPSSYRAGSAGTHRQFVWFDRSGTEISKVGDAVTTSLSQPSLSPDGHRVAFYRGVAGNPDVWLLDLRRGAFSKFTSDPADDVFPVWSPDGSRMIFSSNRRGTHELYQKPVAGDRNEEVLLSTGQPVNATDWSRDGRIVLFTSRDPKSGSDIWALPLDGKPFSIVQTAFDEQGAQFAPDGHWIGYQSNESGVAEVYVRPFPGPGERFAVSIGGGTQVRWGRDGKELFYVARDGRLMAVPIQLTSNTPEIGTPVALFPLPIGGAVQQGDARHKYMVSLDSRQFLVATVKEDAPAPITVILNWKASR